MPATETRLSFVHPPTATTTKAMRNADNFNVLLPFADHPLLWVSSGQSTDTP